MRRRAERRQGPRPARIEKRADSRVLAGYAAVFFQPGVAGTEFELAPGIVERIDRNAFDASLRSRNDVLCTINHNLDRLLGRTSSGTCRLCLDAVGLRYEVDLPDTADGQTVSELCRRGDLNGSSFTFKVLSVQWISEGDIDIRIIEDLDLIELGPVVMPAYESTTASLRNRTDAEEVEAALRRIEADLVKEHLQRVLADC